MLLELHDAYPEYLWFPSVLVNASHSAEHLAGRLDEHRSKHSGSDGSDLTGFIKDLLKEGLGIEDVSDEEVKSLANPSGSATYVLADIVSRRAQIGWSTHGHSGEFEQRYSVVFPTSEITDAYQLWM